MSCNARCKLVPGLQPAGLFKTPTPEGQQAAATAGAESGGIPSILPPIGIEINACPSPQSSMN